MKSNLVQTNIRGETVGCGAIKSFGVCESVERGQFGVQCTATSCERTNVHDVTRIHSDAVSKRGCASQTQWMIISFPI
jgi:hypothetical protein